jgi:prevent-host-death family protein
VKIQLDKGNRRNDHLSHLKIRKEFFMPHFSTVEARNKFSNIINRVAFGKERVILTRRGEEMVALIPAEDIRLLEYIEDQMDLEDARAALKEAKEKGTTSLDALKKEIGL